MTITFEMTLISEYCDSQHRKSEVYRRFAHRDFMVIVYENGFERQAHPFPDLDSAEDWAEDWVLTKQ